MLKIPFSEEERRGNKLMAWWNGVGSAKVFEWDTNALLMERIIGDRSLKTMALDNQDNEATQIICQVADLLHADKKNILPGLTPLTTWFDELFSSADKYGDIIRESSRMAAILLKRQQNITILHGDLHHDNVLYSSERGWLAIDPKGLIGERAFDYVNILCNPNKETALAEGRLTREIDVISQHTGINRRYLLEWTVAWAGLSSVWFLNDNQDGSLPMDVARLALKELNN